MAGTPLKYLNAGYMKTGLTSLNDAMAALGFDAQQGKSKVWKAFRRGDIDTVLANYETADMFSDWPHPYMYKRFHRVYGSRARVFLTIRESGEWYDSLLRHNAHAHPFTHKHHFIFGRYYPVGFRDEHIARYEAHNAEVVRYFEAAGAREQLLVLRTGDADSLETLKAFVGVFSDMDRYPRSNESAKRRHRDMFDVFRKHYNAAVQPLYGRWAPALKKSPGRALEVIEPDAGPAA